MQNVFVNTLKCSLYMSLATKFLPTAGVSNVDILCHILMCSLSKSFDQKCFPHCQSFQGILHLRFGILQAGWEWNAFDRLEDGHLTNNNAEAGNKRLHVHVGKDHPGFYRLATTFKSELEHVKNKVEQLEVGNLYPVSLVVAKNWAI